MISGELWLKLAVGDRQKNEVEDQRYEKKCKIMKYGFHKKMRIGLPSSCMTGIIIYGDPYMRCKCLQ